MGVAVRAAMRQDAAKVAEFAVALFELHAGLDAKRFTQIATQEGAEAYYRERAEHGAVLIAENEGTVVGFAYFEYEPILYADLATKVAWLHDIYVDPAARGSGVGSALLNAVRDEAKRLGANKVLLTVAVGNHDGRRLFEQNRFRTTMLEMMLELDNE